MAVGPPRPRPAVECWLQLMRDGALPASRIPGWPSLGAARAGGSRRRRSCCNAPFSVPQSRALQGKSG